MTDCISRHTASLHVRGHPERVPEAAAIRQTGLFDLSEEGTSFRYTLGKLSLLASYILPHVMSQQLPACMCGLASQGTQRSPGLDRSFNSILPVQASKWSKLAHRAGQTASNPFLTPSTCDIQVFSHEN